MWPFNRKRNLIRSLGNHRTPDIAVLEQSEFHLLFVCDDMMHPHKNYSKIENNSAQVSRGFTRHPFDFRVLRHTGKGLPIADRDGLKIKGEVHAVESSHFTELDNHYDNGVQFIRLRTDILVSDRQHERFMIGNESKIHFLPRGSILTKPELGIRHYLSDQHVYLIHAYMYVALVSYWTDQPKGGFSYPRANVEFPKEETNWLPKYYKYPINRNRCPR